MKLLNQEYLSEHGDRILSIGNQYIPRITAIFENMFKDERLSEEEANHLYFSFIITLLEDLYIQNTPLVMSLIREAAARSAREVTQ